MRENCSAKLIDRAIGDHEIGEGIPQLLRRCPGSPSLSLNYLSIVAQGYGYRTCVPAGLRLRGGQFTALGRQGKEIIAAD